MLAKKEIKLYYFSGTGNTLRIAKEVIKQFDIYGYKSELINMISIEPAKVRLDCIIGLAFPVAVQSTNPLVWNFINELPKSKKTPIFMFDTLEAFSGGVVGPVKKVLKAKGYECIGAKEFKMSSNMLISEKKAKERDEKNLKATLEVKRFVEALIHGEGKWRRVPVFSDLMRNISKGDLIWEKLNRKIKVDRTMCVQCGMCAKYCPTLSIKLTPYPSIQKSCISCMRCVNICPKNAFTLKDRKVFQIKKVLVKELGSINN